MFQELQTRNRELTETLEQQTATGEILRVIASSPTDVQPVFDVIAESSARLCGAVHPSVFGFDGSLIHLMAFNNWSSDVWRASEKPFPVLWVGVA